MMTLSDDGEYNYLKGIVDRWVRRRRKHTQAERIEITGMIYQSHLEHCIDGQDREALLNTLYGGDPPWMKMLVSQSTES